MIRRLWVLFALLLLISGCSAGEDADVIRRLIEKSAGLAETKKVGELMQLTGKGFIAMPGRRSADEVKRILFAAFMHYGKFKIHYPKPGVEIGPGGNQASATIYFAIVRQNQPLPGLKELYENPRLWLEAASEKADLYRLKLKLVKKKSEWVAMEAQLEGFKGIGF